MSTQKIWFCGLCHPPAAPVLAVEWRDIAGQPGAFSGNKQSHAFDEGPRIPASDLRTMWSAYANGRWDSPEIDKVRRRLACRWSDLEKRWRFSVLTEKQASGVPPRQTDPRK